MRCDGRELIIHVPTRQGEAGARCLCLAHTIHVPHGEVSAEENLRMEGRKPWERAAAPDQ